MPEIVEAVLRIARSQVGVVEVGGNNRGPQVEAYLRSTGTPAGEPWCASFVSWVLQQAGVAQVPRTADTWALKTWAKKNGCLHTQPQRGDLFLLQRYWGPRDGIQPYHVGLVTTVGPTQFGTIEGNTSGRDRADGDGVEAKAQALGGSTAFVRWADVVGGIEPARDDLPDVIRIAVDEHDGRGEIRVNGIRYHLKGWKLDGKPFGNANTVLEGRKK